MVIYISHPNVFRCYREYSALGFLGFSLDNLHSHKPQVTFSIQHYSHQNSTTGRDNSCTVFTHVKLSGKLCCKLCCKLAEFVQNPNDFRLDGKGFSGLSGQGRGIKNF